MAAAEWSSVRVVWCVSSGDANDRSGKAEGREERWEAGKGQVTSVDVLALERAEPVVDDLPDDLILLHGGG